MANHPVAPMLLREGDWGKLSRLVRSTLVWAGLVQRARIGLSTVDRLSNTNIAQRASTTCTTVIA